MSDKTHKRLIDDCLDVSRKITSKSSENTEICIPYPTSKASPPFKIRHANQESVIKWLKGQGIEFDDGVIPTHFERYALVNEHGIIDTCNDEIFKSARMPELVFEFRIEITSISIDNSSEIARLESELEALLNKKNEIQAKLSKLKS